MKSRNSKSFVLHLSQMCLSLVKTMVAVKRMIRICMCLEESTSREIEPSI